jgi:hypothetical protein
LGYGDTINEDIPFTTETVFIRGKEDGPYGFYEIYMTYGDYIPVCLKNGSFSESRFGWIKMSDVSWDGITLDSYAVDISPCLPDGIKFETQAQIDSFRINYPWCYEMAGDVIISGEDITSVATLDELREIHGDLLIGYYDGGTPFGNPNLTTLMGFWKLTKIGGQLGIFSNEKLTSLLGLHHLDSIGESCIIYSNNALTNINALDNLTVIPEDLQILFNPNLQTLSGLEYISIIGNDLSISYTHELASLAEIKNLMQVGGKIDINGNLQLKDLGAFINLDSIWGGLSVAGNPSLTNLNGFDSLLYAGSNIHIAENDSLTSLSGFHNLSNVQGTIEIYENNSLESLSSLKNLRTIGEGLYVTNFEFLPDLSGLDSLSSIGGDLRIEHNNGLTDLSGLGGLKSIGGKLKVTNNDDLVSLAGIDHIESNSIEKLTIFLNPELSTCEVESVCAYLADPNGDIIIHDNAIGCNTAEEVQDSCEVHFGIFITDVKQEDLLIYPNPARQEINFSTEGFSIDEVIIYTLTGQQVYTLMPKDESIDISILQPGMYLVEVKVEGRKVRRKLVVQ